MVEVLLVFTKGDFDIVVFVFFYSTLVLDTPLFVLAFLIWVLYIVYFFIVGVLALLIGFFTLLFIIIFIIIKFKAIQNFVYNKQNYNEQK